jgi:phosphoserine phosphatase RsbX
MTGAAGAMVEIGHAGAAFDGEDSGDVHVVAPFRGGVVIAMIDGLGHGPEAADAARTAARVIEAYADEALVPLVQRCHEALRKTRGVALSLASLSAVDAAATWLGIGNVEGVLWRADRTASPAQLAIPLRGGVVGYQLPVLRPSTHAVSRGDTLILVTDGIRSGFATGLAIERSAQDLADTILRRHARGADDALVLVARYLGGAA